MAIFRRRLGENLWYYQYVSLTNLSDKFYFAPGDEVTRIEALREARAFKVAMSASRKGSAKTWKNTQKLNRDRYVRIKEAPDDIDLSCTLDLTIYEAGQ